MKKSQIYQAISEQFALLAQLEEGIGSAPTTGVAPTEKTASTTKRLRQPEPEVEPEKEQEPEEVSEFEAELQAMSYNDLKKIRKRARDRPIG